MIPNLLKALSGG